MGKAGFNEPDNIRDFDNDPRSPYYVEPPAKCFQCGENFDVDEGVTSDKAASTVMCSSECVEKFEEDEYGT